MLKKILFSSVLILSSTTVFAQNDWKETVSELLRNEQFAATIYQFNGSENYQAFKDSVNTFKNFRKKEIREDYEKHDAFASYVFFRFHLKKEQPKKALQALHKLFLHTYDSKEIVFEKMVGVAGMAENPALQMAYLEYYDTVHGIDKGSYLEYQYNELKTQHQFNQKRIDSLIRNIDDSITGLRKEITPEGITFRYEVLEQNYRDSFYKVEAEVNEG